jgi:hypothetical protein
MTGKCQLCSDGSFAKRSIPLEDSAPAGAFGAGQSLAQKTDILAGDHQLERGVAARILASDAIDYRPEVVILRDTSALCLHFDLILPLQGFSLGQRMALGIRLCAASTMPNFGDRGSE